MATVEELRDEMRQLIATVNQMATNLSAAAAAPPVGPAAAGRPPSVIVLNVEQIINSPSGKLVQLSRQDSQCTDKEK